MIPIKVRIATFSVAVLPAARAERMATADRSCAKRWMI
jgi:hypothetical protein